MEQRFTSGDVDVSTPAGMTVREAGETKARVVRGVAARYYNGTPGTQFALWEGAVERIMPGAFDRAIRERDDVRALFNHDANYVLGRTSSGTLKLTVKPDGLHYEARLPGTSYSDDLQRLLDRGDVSGSSFAFAVEDESWTSDGDLKVREVRGLKLFDVSPVTYPAYKSTSAGLRDDGKKRPMDEYTRKAKVRAEQVWLDCRLQAAGAGVR